MTEVKKILEIMKVRWLEVAVIILLPFLGQLFRKLLSYSVKEQFITPQQYTSLIFTLPYLVLSIVLVFLKCGFLRTVYLEGDKRQSIPQLFRVGTQFFWRFLGLGCLYMVPFYILILLTTRLVRPLTFLWTSQLSIAVLNLVLIKLILLLPAVIIVRDCKVFESFNLLRNYKLLDAKTLIGLYCFRIAFSFLNILLYFITGVTISQNIFFTVAYGIVSHFLYLMISIMAVRFVAGSYEVNDDRDVIRDLYVEDF